MNVVVQKYGGTSVADISCIKRVARRVKKTWSAGNRVVVVVSARAGVTNELIERAKAIRKNPSDRELDMLMTCGEQETIALLAMALEALSVPAVSRTGWQAGIITDGMHSKARIREVKGGDVRKQLRAGKVVVLAGFQGVNESGDLTTFGRGGSDLSAIAMAGALKAKTCQIFTDVEGVFTADPRIVPNACKMPAINYEELLELASSGSKVMQTRAVEFAQKHNIPFEVRSSFSTKSGTQVKKKVKSLEDTLISGVAIDKNQVRVSVTELPDRPGAAAAVFKVMAEAGVVVDMIVQNVARNGKANLTFTVPSEDAFRAEKALREHLKEGAGGKLGRSTNIAKVSVVGVGMRSHSGVASTFFEALANAGINMLMISTSEIKISVAVSPEFGDEATRVAHRAFGLGK
ncbi:MAG: aspartate kinase [Opitutae bacterium]|nr:aspartate kinase [Opitutae bacterium]MEC9124131.1 aspartate kinase [Verrucomicrobiota bacterium]